MDEKLQKYYEYLRDKGAYVPDTFESFKTGLASDEGAKKYNAYLSKNGYQDFQTFSGSLPQDQDAPTMQVNQGMPKIDDLATTPIKPSLDNGQDGKQTPQQFSDNGYSPFMKINQGVKPLDNDRPEKYTMPSNEIFDKLNTIFTEDNNYNEKREGSRGRLDVPMEEWEKDTHQSIEKKKEKEISELNYLGYDYNDLQKNFGGLLPEVKSQLDLNKLMHMKDENPEQYVSAVSGIQVQNDFLKGLKEYKSAHPESNVDAVFGQVQQMMASVPTSYADQIKTLGALTAYAKKYTNEGDEISKKLGQYYIAGFDGIAPDTDEIIAQDKRSQYFSKNQMLALQKLDITDPAMAESAKNLELNIDTSKLPFDTQLGYQYKMRELEVQGAYQRMNGISNQMHKLIEKSKVQPLTPEEEQAYDNYSKLYESARQDFVSADKEYPLAAANDNIALAQDALGIAPHNQFTRMLLVAGQGTRNAAEGLITLPFGVKSFFLGRSQNDYLIELGLLGAMKGDEVENFKTEDKRLNITYDIGMTNDLRKFADGVKNDKNLSDAEKIGKVAAYVQSNPESISKIALEKPKFNITASAYFNTLTDALGMVVPFIATAELGGMIGLGSKASTAASVMLTGINQDIASRVESGDPNPMGNALISTSVNAGFFAGVDKLSELRKLYGTKTAIGKTISKLTDAQLKKYLENPPTALVNWFKGLSESAKESIKASVKIAAASLAGSTTNKLIEGKDITVDDLKHEATMTLLDQLGQNFVMAGIGQLRRGMAGNTNYYDIAQNGDYYLSQIDKAVQDGKMTLAAAEKSKKTLITIVKAFGRTSPIDNDGQQLSDRKLVRAFNINAEKQLREDLAGEAMPEKLKQKNDAELNNLTLHENVVYSTDNELQERRAEIVKQLGESTAGGLGDGKTNLQNELNLIDGEMRIRGIGVAQPQSEAQQEQKYEPKHTGLTKLGAAKEIRSFSNINAEYFDGGSLKDDAPNDIKNEYNELRSIIDGVKFEPMANKKGSEMPVSSKAEEKPFGQQGTKPKGLGELPMDEKDTPVMDLIGSKVMMHGKKGYVKVDDENNVLFDSGDKEILLGKTTDDSFTKSTASEHSIETIREPKIELSGDNVKIDGENYSIISFNKDNDGNLVSISLLDKNGKKITKRDSDIALDIAIEKNNQEFDSRELSKQGNKNASDEIRKQAVESLGNSVDYIIESMPDEVADVLVALDKGIEAIAPNEMQGMVVRASEWVDKSMGEIEKSSGTVKEKKEAIKALNKFNKDLNKYYEKLEKQRQDQAKHSSEKGTAKVVGKTKQGEAESKEPSNQSEVKEPSIADEAPKEQSSEPTNKAEGVSSNSNEGNSVVENKEPAPKEEAGVSSESSKAQQSVPHPILNELADAYDNAKGGFDKTNAVRGVALKFSGDRNKKKRQEILSAMRGKKATIKESGVIALEKEFQKWIDERNKNDKTSFQSENKDTQEIQEAKDLVKDIYDDGFKKNGKAPSVEEVKNEVAKIIGDHSYDNVIEDAYGKLSKELKVTGKDVPDNSFREQDEAISAESNELSKGIMKRVNDFLGKVFGVKGNKIEFANNVDEVRAKAQEGQPLFMTESIPYLSEKDVIKNSKGDVIGIKPEVEKAIREEREKIESEAKANDTYHKAPNGKPSKLTKPQWVTVRTIRFKNWFGDWEKDPGNASKVVDENGEPMVVFHGTLNDFDTFSKEETSNSSSGEREMFFVGKTPEVAEAFGAFQSFDDDAAGLNIKPAFLSSKKPFDYKDKAQLAEFKRWAVKNLGSKDMYDELYNSSLYGNGNWKVIESAEFQKFLKEKGYDGFYVTERIGSSHSVENIGVFSSSQIKSSTANKGTFDSETGDTRYMYNAKGEILGAVDPKTGKIYLNKEKLNPNTLIHEPGHIWAEWADANAKDLMDAGLEKVRNSPYIKEVLSKDFYLKEALKYGEKGSEGYNRYLEKEALATAIGDEGGKFVMEAKRKSFRDWVNQLWDSVAKHFGIKDKTAEEISKMTLAEFAKGAAADILDPNAKFEKKVDDEKDSVGSEPPPISPDDTASPSGREIAGIKHKITAGVRSALGLPKYQRTSVADAQRVSDAIDLYHKQGEIKKVMDALRNNEKISPEQQLMMGLHIAALKKEASDNPTNANLKRAQEAIQLLDKLGTEASHMLRVRKNIFNDPESLADYMLSKAESLGIDADDMTIEQKQKAKEDYESEKVVKDKYEKHVKALEAKATEKDAQAELTKQVKLPHRSRKSPEETRKAAKDRIAARMAARRSDDMQFMFDAEDGSVGGTKDAEIDTETAKDIADVVRSFAEIHGDDLAKVTEDTVAYLSDIVDGIKPEDVHDVIAGKYSDKKTKSQLAETMENIRLEVKLTEKLQDELAEQNKPLHQRLKESTQSKEKIELARNQRIKTLKDKIAALQKTNRWDLQAAKQIEKLEAQNEGLRNELESAESGILKPKTKPKTAQDKREQTAREIELKKEAKEIRKQIAKTDAAILDAKKKSMQRLIDKTNEQIKKGDFETRKQTPIELDSKGIKLKNELLEVRAKRKLEQLRDEHSKRGTIKKGADMIADIVNIPRAIMATGDYSAVLRQSVIATLSHPYFAKKAGVMMVKAGASQKAYDEFFYDLEHSPKYDTYVNSGLAITDINAAEMKFHEERYMSSLASKIPIVGEPIKVKGKTKVPGLNIIKGSERAYTIYLNAMRIMLFDHYASMLEAKGKTFANSPDAYKEIAKFANNMTGRGDVGKLLNGAAPLLNAFFFSPRLIASRVNMLTYLMKPSFWSKAPVEIRRAYFRDMGIFIGTGLTTLAAFAALSSALYNDDDKNKIYVGFDPLSSDFGKIRQSNTDFDIWGGYQQYAKLAAIMFAGSRKTQTGKEIKLDGEGAFGESRGSVVGRFARSKLSPPAGIATDWMMGGETFLGEKIKWNADEKKKEISTQKYIAEHFAPMNVISVVEAAKDLGWAKALLLTVPSNALGVGTNTYERSKKTTAPELNDGVSAYFKQHKIDVPEIKAPKEIQEKDSNGRNSGKRDLTEQEAEKYVNTWYEEFANKMKNNVIDKPENSWNGTTDDGFYFYGVKTKDLTAEQMKVVIERQKRYATESTKKKLFK